MDRVAGIVTSFMRVRDVWLSGIAADLGDRMEDRRVRIFISSPADVRPERLIAERAVRRLAREFEHYFDVEPVLWEREPLVASHHFQELIVPPRETDIVVVVLWSRLGVLLPADKFLGPLSGKPVTGTEWEFEDALASARRRQLPDLLLYRKTAKAMVELGDRAQVEEQQRQTELVEEFMRRWTRDAEGKSFTAASWPFADGAEFEMLLEEKLRELLRRRVAGPQDTVTVRWHHGSPYRGLEAFGPEHEQIFFGRTRARNELREALARQVERGSAFVLVTGASGSGKSSLVKAGLLPELQDSGMVGRVALVRYAVTRPGAIGDPVLGLATALFEDTALPELAKTPLEYTPARLSSLLGDVPHQAGQPIQQGLSVASKVAGLTDRGEARLLLVVDQLEEAFTAKDMTAEVRRHYLTALDALAKSGLVWVIATLRSDFYERLSEVPALLELAKGDATYWLKLPEAGEIGQMIRQPAREAGLRFEVNDRTGGSLDEVIREAATKDTASLPLQGYLLDQLWQRRTGEGLLTFEAYNQLGGLEGAIGRKADQLLNEQQQPEVRDALPRLLRALVTVGQGAKAAATARAVRADRFAVDSPERRLIEVLLDSKARLLVADGDSIRVAHEALLSHWDRAREQIAQDRLDLQLRARLEDAAARWLSAAAKNQDSLLLSLGLPLSEAEDLLKRRRDELELTLISYIEKSTIQATSRQRRTTRLLSAAVAVFGLLTIVAGAGAWFGLTGQQRAEEQAQVANSEQKKAQLGFARATVAAAATAVHPLDHSSRMAISLSVLPDGSSNSNFAVSGIAEFQLYDAFLRNREKKLVAYNNPRPRQHSRSRDGTYMLISYNKETWGIVNALRSPKYLSINTDGKAIPRADVSENGSLIAGATDAGEIVAWVRNGSEYLGPLELGFHGPIPKIVRFCSNSAVATASEDRTIVIWNLAVSSQKVITPLLRMLGMEGVHVGNAVTAFDCNARTAVVGLSDGSIRAWELDLKGTWRTTVTEKIHDSSVAKVRLSMTGEMLFSISDQGVPKSHVIHSSSLRSESALSSLGDGFNDLVVCANANCALVLSDKGRARLWSMDSKHPTVVDLETPDKAPLWTGAFSLEGRHVAVGSETGAIYIWDTSIPAPVLTMQLRGHLGGVVSLIFGSGGNSLVSSSLDGTVREWAVTRLPPQAMSLADGEPAIRNSDIASDNSTLVTITGETIGITDLSGDKLSRTVLGSGISDLRYPTVGGSGRLVSAISPEHTYIWEKGGDASWRRHRVELPVSAPNKHIFNSTGSRLVTAGRGRISLIETKGGNAKQYMLSEPDNDFYDAIFLSDEDRVVVADGKGYLSILDVVDGRLSILSRTKIHDRGILKIARSLDGRLVATASLDSTARIISVDNNQILVRNTLQHPGIVRDVTFAVDGNVVATGTEEGEVRVWRRRGSGEYYPNVLNGHQGPIFSVRFNQNGEHLLSVSQDQSVRLWHVEEQPNTGLIVAEIPLGVHTAMFAGNNRYIVTAGDGGVLMWPYGKDTAQRVLDARNSLPRCLTVSQRAMIGLPIPANRTEEQQLVLPGPCKAL